MITLYTFGPAFGLPDPSPFVTKAEMLLKLAGLPYRKEITGLRSAPKGKLPYIQDEDRVVPDSTFIRWHIENKYAIDFDSGLSPEQRGAAWAIEKMLEDNLYWASMRSRWLDDANFAKGPTIFFKGIPWPLRPLVESAIRRKVKGNLHAHGMGRHTVEEQALIASKAIESVALILGEKPYLMGSRPCGADATVFAFMAGTLCAQFDSPLRTAAESHPNLVRYVDAMYRNYYPEHIRMAA